MKRLLLILCIAVCVSGCDYKYQYEEINALQKPVIVAATSRDGGILLRGGDGKVYLANSTTYLGLTLKDCKVGDVIVPK